MRPLFAVLLASLVLGCRPAPPRHVEVEPVRVSPGALDFGHVWLSRDSVREVTLTNPSQVTQDVTLESSAPFSVALPSLRVGGGDTQLLQVRFAPQAAGSFTGTLRIAESEVSLTGVAEDVPACAPSTPCRRSTFDFEAGVCVETNEIDGTGCDVSASCFTSAQCHDGTCVGATTDCDDGNPCTIDACGADGCVFIDDSLSCELPADPCLAPACDADAGCTSVPVVDGTPCGPRTCQTADICLDARCVTRAAPQVQACADVVVGWPAGPGDVDGLREHARFSGVRSMLEDTDGTLYVVDGLRIRRVGPTGDVRTIAGGGAMWSDGFGARAGFAYPALIGWDRQRNMVVADYGPAGGRVRKVTRSGNVSTLCIDCLDGRFLGAISVLADGRVLLGPPASTLNVPFAFLERSGRLTPFLLRGAGNGSVDRGDPSDPMSLCILGSNPEHSGLYHLAEPDDAGVSQATRVNEFCTGRVTAATRLRADGGVEVLAISGSTDDGPVDAVGLADATLTTPVAFSPSGNGYTLYDSRRYHLRRVEGGQMRTLAGPIPRIGLVDGSPARLLSSPMSLVARDDGVLVGDGVALREFRDALMFTHVADAGAEVASLSLNDDGSVLWASASALTRFDTTTWAAADNWSVTNTSRVTRAQQLNPGLLVLGTGRAQGTVVDYDGGVLFMRDCTWIGRSLEPGAGLASCNRPGIIPVAALWRIDADGGANIISPPDAGYETMGAYEESPNVLVALRGRVLGRLDLVTWSWTPLFEFSELPTSMAPAPDGGILVGVSHAILRVKLQ